MSKLSSAEVRPHLVTDALRRHLLLILGCVVALAVAAGGLAATRAATYESSAKVLIRPTLGNPFAPDTGQSGPQVNIAMETESQVAQSAPVAEIANPKLTKKWVLGTGTVKASVPPNTQVIQITFRAPSAALAQAGAETVAQSYLDYRSQQTTDTQKTRLDILTKQAEAVRKSLEAASKAAATVAAPAEAAQQVQLYANQLVTIQNSMSTLEASGANPGSIITPAPLPNAAGGLGPLVFWLGGGLLGLAIGFVVAIWRERRDKRVRGGTDTAVGDVPIIATEPSEPSFALGASRRSHESTTDAGNRQALVHRLRGAILAKMGTRSAITVAAVTDGAPAAAIAVDLATALHQAGYRVALVATDAGHQVERLLGIDIGQGLSTALQGRPTSESVVDVGGITVLPGGFDLAQHESLLFSERFEHVLGDLREQADYVIVAAPLAATPVAVGMAVATDTTVLVGIDRLTTAQDVEGVATRSEQLAIRLLGVVLTTRPGRRGAPAEASSSAQRHHGAHRAQALGSANDGTQTQVAFSGTERTEPQPASSDPLVTQ